MRSAPSLQATALELRAEELQLNGDMRSGLLYEVASRREENRRLSADASAKSERIAALEFEARELQLRLEKDEADAALAAQRSGELLGRLDSLEQAHAALQEVRACPPARLCLHGCARERMPERERETDECARKAHA